MSLRNRLAERRLRLGLTQSQLAERAQVARQTISGIESGAYGPSLEVGFKLARALGVSVDALFSLPEPVAPAGEPAQLRAVHSRIGERDVQRPLAGGQIALPAAHRVGLGAQAAQIFSGEALFLAGCDPALGLLGAHARRRRPTLETIWWPIGNGAALAQLEAGQAHAALVHAPEGAVVAPAPKSPARRLRLAARPIGLMVAAGNPKAIRGVHDLARPGVRLVNREPGSGARSLLDERLLAADLPPERLAGYERILAGHADVARAIAWGLADAGIGIAGAAAEAGLEFIPLAVEWCDLWLPLNVLDDPLLQPLLDSAVADTFRLDLSALGEYATNATGKWVD